MGELNIYKLGEGRGLVKNKIQCCRRATALYLVGRGCGIIKLSY